jgi:hypothetical protein
MTVFYQFLLFLDAKFHSVKHSKVLSCMACWWLQDRCLFGCIVYLRCAVCTIGWLFKWSSGVFVSDYRCDFFGNSVMQSNQQMLGFQSHQPKRFKFYLIIYWWTSFKQWWSTDYTMIRLHNVERISVCYDWLIWL